MLEVSFVLKQLSLVAKNILKTMQYHRKNWLLSKMKPSVFEFEERDEGVQFAGVKLRPLFPTTKEKLDFPLDHPMLKHCVFVRDNSKVLPQISIPDLSCCHFRTAPEDISPKE